VLDPFAVDVEISFFKETSPFSIPFEIDPSPQDVLPDRFFNACILLSWGKRKVGWHDIC